MDVIYINDHYTPLALAWFVKNKITRPTLGKVYTIREVIKPAGKEGHGILLNELINHKVEVMHPILHQNIMVETSWNINRFTDLQGNVLTKKILKQKPEYQL